MLKYIIIATLLSFPTLPGCELKDSQNYEGNWIGELPDRHSFNFSVTLSDMGSNTYRLIVDNGRTLIDKKLKSADNERIQLNIDDQLHFDLYPGNGGQELAGFIKSGRFFYHTTLNEVEPNTFEGKWNPFMLNDGLISDDLLLYVENSDESGLVAYPFFGDQRFRGTWASGFEKKGDTLFFKDDNTGFNFHAIFLKDEIGLEIYLTDGLITKTTLTYSKQDWEYKTDSIAKNQSTATPVNLDDGWATSNIADFGINRTELQRLIDDINSKKLENTHSVLIAKNEKLVFEAYFDGFNAYIPHDQRSASKSISSAMIGIAIADGFIESVDQKIYELLPETYQYTKNDSKSKIRIEDLLTMSSGLDVNNLASEEYYQDPSLAGPWLKTVLEAPMVKEPGTYADYGSANPFLLGVCLDESLAIPMEIYMDKKLFAPLGITNYINQTDDTMSTPYFGGGMLITPRDMLKFGQLYLNKGIWKGEQIISEQWVEDSFKKHVQLQDTRDKNDYGYQWWHDTYTTNGEKISTIEARGAGGQFIFVIPELQTVVVITSGNFRNGKGNQPRKILKEYILPAMKI